MCRSTIRIGRAWRHLFGAGQRAAFGASTSIFTTGGGWWSRYTTRRVAGRDYDAIASFGSTAARWPAAGGVPYRRRCSSDRPGLAGWVSQQPSSIQPHVLAQAVVQRGHGLEAYTWPLCPTSRDNSVDTNICADVVSHTAGATCRHQSLRRRFPGSNDRGAEGARCGTAAREMGPAELCAPRLRAARRVRPSSCDVGYRHRPELTCQVSDFAPRYSVSMTRDMTRRRSCCCTCRGG